MERYFEKKVLELYKKIDNIVDNIDMFKSNAAGIDFIVDLPEDIKKEFFYIVDKVILSLMEYKDNFYGYFLFQMGREIRFDITTQTSVNFKNDKAIKASAEMVFDLSSQNTTIVDEFYNSLKESGEKEYGSKFNISKKDKTIMVEMSASSKEDEFEAVLSTSTDTTLDDYIKTMEANSFTCEKK